MNVWTVNGRSKELAGENKFLSRLLRVADSSDLCKGSIKEDTLRRTVWQKL